MKAVKNHTVREQHRLETLSEKLWAFVYDALFLTALGLTVTVVTLLLVSSEPLVIRASKILLLIAWLFYSAAVRKANFFGSHSSNRRALGEATTSLAAGLLLALGFYYIPWHQAPKLYTTAFSQLISAGAKATVNIDVLNDSDYQSSVMNMDGEVRLVPYAREIDSKDPSDEAAIRALDDSVATGIFNKLEESTILHDLSHKGGLGPHMKAVYSLWTDRTLTADEVKRHEQGKLIVFVAGRIKYKDSDGCLYKSDFCGFWGKSEWLMANCHSGHFEQGVRLKDKCQTE
jgi:hypothetical protein